MRHVGKVCKDPLQGMLAGFQFDHFFGLTRAKVLQFIARGQRLV